MGQTGILIGEILNMSTATLVVETDCTESNIKVKRELESGWFQWLTMPLPASVSIQSGLNIPRYPSLKGIMGAKKKKINTINYGEIVNSSQTQRIESISVPETSKQTEYIEGNSDEIASRLAAILKKEIKVV
jgi:electron transfer flavoprotein beta subunit